MTKIIAAAFALVAGCTWHLPRNAPGHVDPRKPPPPGVDVEEPGDPGETVTILNVGGYSGAGVGFGGPGWDGAGVAAEAGVEVGLHWGDSDESHQQPTLFPWWHAFPRTGFGLNAGASFVRHDGDGADLGHVFLELQERLEIFGGYAGGYGWSPVDGAHGPHVTVFFSSLYLRGAYMFDRGASVVMGIVLKVPAMTWIESR